MKLNIFKKEEEKREKTTLSDEIKKKLIVKPPSEESWGKSKSIVFEKLKPSRVKRELIPFILISIITLSSFIFFSYQDSTDSIAYSPEVPNINIEVSSEITNYSQQCFLKISPISNEFVKSGWANRYLAANIRKRDSDGGFSFELYQNENLFQIRDDDDWLLLPQGKYLDSLRTKMAFDIFNMIKDNSPNYRLPHSKLIEVFVNGNYNGLYLLCERLDRKLMNLEQENFDNPEENDIIFKTTNWDGDFYTIPNSIDSPWEQIYPNIIDFSYIPKNLTEFIHNATEKDFFNKEKGVFTIFDKYSIIDNLLFGLLVGHEIIEGSSYYLVLNQESEKGFFFLPWNFAQSWGFYKHGRIPIDLWLNRDKNVDSIVWSKLYHRLLFPQNSSINIELITEIVNRWSYIRTNYWNSDDILSYFNELQLPIQNTLIRATSDNDLVADLVETIENWIITRANLIDDIFNGPNTIFSDNFTSKYQEEDDIFGFSSQAARRQYYKSTELFSTHKIHEINIVIQRDYFNDILNRKFDNNRWTNRLYMPCDMSFDDYSINNAGFRIRGNYNNLYPKNSFKLKFSEPDLYIGEESYKNFPDNEDRRFLGVKRLNLRAAPIDFSFMNEFAGYELYNILGYPCPRISWTKLYLTKTDEQGNIIDPKVYIGLYLLTEDIDKTFLRFNFKNPEGNLYKSTDIQADLDYVADVKNYVNPWDGRQVYELRTNEEQDDYSDLQKFVQYINFNWSNIREVTNLTLLGKYFAASNFQGNWDDYVFLPHNYFLYSDPKFGFVLLPWDIEQNFNIGTPFSIIGWVDPYSPDFRFAPLLVGYKGYFDWISQNFGIDPNNRPLWDNLITESDFTDPYFNSHQKIVDNITSIINKVNDGFYLIEHDVIQPYTFTDPVPNSGTEWYPNEIPLTWYVDVAIPRVLNFLNGRTAYVISQLP